MKIGRLFPNMFVGLFGGLIAAFGAVLGWVGIFV
jgi:hypothetical protein